MVTQLYRREQIISEDVSALLTNPINYDIDYILLQPGGNEDTVIFTDFFFSLEAIPENSEYLNFRAELFVRDIGGSLVKSRLLLNQLVKFPGVDAVYYFLFHKGAPLRQDSGGIFRLISMDSSSIVVTPRDQLILRFNAADAGIAPIRIRPNVYLSYRRITQAWK